MGRRADCRGTEYSFGGVSQDLDRRRTLKGQLRVGRRDGGGGTITSEVFYVWKCNDKTSQSLISFNTRHMKRGQAGKRLFPLTRGPQLDCSFFEHGCLLRMSMHASL